MSLAIFTRLNSFTHLNYNVSNLITAKRKRARRPEKGERAKGSAWKGVGTRKSQRRRAGEIFIRRERETKDSWENSERRTTEKIRNRKKVGREGKKRRKQGEIRGEETASIRVKKFYFIIAYEASHSVLCELQFLLIRINSQTFSTGFLGLDALHAITTLGKVFTSVEGYFSTMGITTTVLKSLHSVWWYHPTVLIISPTVLNILYGNDRIIPQYWWYL